MTKEELKSLDNQLMRFFTEHKAEIKDDEFEIIGKTMAILIGLYTKK